MVAETTGLTGIQEPWAAIRGNPSFYESTPLDYLWVVNTVSPDRVTAAMPRELFRVYCDKVIGSFQRLVHAGPDYMEWLKEKHGVDERQRLDSGAPHQPFAPANYFVVPTKHRVEWHWMLTSAAMDLGARHVVYEEPEFWVGTGYSQAMRAMYLQTYGEEVTWSDDACTFPQRWRMERLKERILAGAYVELFGRVKERDPEVKTIIPMHDIGSYQTARITSPFAQNISNPHVDAIQSQTWDWALEWAMDERIAAYVDLAYFVFSAKFRDDLDLWLLTDPANDPLEVDAQNLRDYRATVDTGILLGFSTHHIPWPRSRLDAIGNAGWHEYAAEVGQNFRIHRSGAKFGRSRMAKDSHPKIGFLYCQARNYVTYPSREGPGRSPLTEVTRFFAEEMLGRGQKFQVLETELVDRPGMLDDLCLLVADGEAGGFIPEKTCADALVEWIRRGGVVLWLGDVGCFHGIPEYHASSLGYLAERMGISCGEVKMTHPGGVSVRKVGGPFNLPDTLYLKEAFSFRAVEGAEILYTFPDDTTFAWSMPWGDGKLVYFGCPCHGIQRGKTPHWPIIRKLLEERGILPGDDGLVRFERLVNDLETYEILWLPRKSGSAEAIIRTGDWETGEAVEFAVGVKGGHDLVVLKTPYFCAFSEDAIPVDTLYGDDRVEIFLESRGRSWALAGSEGRQERASLFFPSPDRVRGISVSGRSLQPSGRMSLPLGTGETRIAVEFRSPLPILPGSGKASL